MASDDDTIYVDVAARFDEASADKAVNEIKGKFAHAGDSIKDSLSGALGSVADHFKDLGGTLHDALGDSLGKGLPGARHTTATLLMIAGVPEDVRMDILGHAGAAVHRGYAHGTTALSRDHMNKALGELLA
jgi:integrase